MASKTHHMETLCLHELFEIQAEQENPDSVAVVFDDRHLSYHALNQYANHLGNHLTQLGVGPEVLVGIHMERSIELAIGLFGILKAGGVCVPLDPMLGKERIHAIMGDTGMSTILTQHSLKENLLNDHKSVMCLELDHESPVMASPRRPVKRITADNLAYVFYTSGSTGKPKGVMSTHKARMSRLIFLQRTIPLNGMERHLLKTSIGFGPFLREFFWPLSYGGTVIMACPEGHRDPAYLLHLINRERIGLVSFVPSMLRAVSDHAELSSCETLTHILCGGERLPPELPARVAALTGAELYMFYGTTEASFALYWYADRKHPSVPVTLGRRTDMDVYVITQNGLAVQPGMAGELCISGSGLTRGYLNHPDLSAEKFSPNPFGAGEGCRMYKTGDYVRYQQGGEFEYLGRMDHRIKLRGYRIELGEIEAALRQQKGIQEAVVILRAEAGDDPRLVAYVSMPTGHHFDHIGLRNALQQHLPAHMVPSTVVSVKAFPHTANGKIDRKALAAWEVTHCARGTDYVAPHTVLEEFLVDLWQDVLKIERIGIHDNFFEIGGHSLLATQVMARLRNTLEVDIHLRTLFEQPTIQQFARSVETLLREPCGTEVRKTHD